MTDRTVTVRLRLDTAGVAGPANAAAGSFEQVGRSAQAAAATAQAAAERSTTAVGGTFGAAQRASATAVTGIETAATRSSQALANTASAAARSTSAAAQAAVSGTTTAATAAARSTTTAAAAAAQATARTGAAAAEVSATFRGAGTAATAALGDMESAASRSSLALAGTSRGISAATMAATTGVSQLSLANRLALGEALQASTGIVAAETRAATGFRALGAAAVTSGAEQAEGWRTARLGALAFVGIFVAAAAVTASFDKSMSGVEAVAGATTAQMTQLRAAALEAGKDTAFTASQAADAEGELARAGVSVADITGGALKGSLSLAAAGQLSLADAATISAQAMNTFGLQGSDVGHVADVLAAGANKSAADVSGLALALRQGGLVAKQTGLSLDDTVAVLSAFADKALIGSDAGTSMKTMLQRLTPQSQQAKDMMTKLGLETYDAQGKFVGLTTLAGNMQKAFSGLTPQARNSAMSVIFGSDAVRGATVLYQEGATGMQKYIDEVNDTGAANRMASTQLNNLSGDLKALKGSLEVALIDSGSQANGVLRDMAKWLTVVVNGYSSLPPWLQGTTLALFGVVGAIALVGTTFILALPKIAAFKVAVTDVAVTMPRMAAAASASADFLMGPFGIAIGLGVAALAAFGFANKDSAKQVTDFDSAIQEDTGHIGEHTRAMAAQALAQNGAFDAAKKYGIAQSTVLDAALGNKTALDQVNTALDTQMKAFLKQHGLSLQGKSDVAGQIQAGQKLTDSLNGTNGSINKSITAYKDQQAALDGAKGSSKGLGDQALTTASDLDTQQTAVQALTAALNTLNGVNITSAQDQIAFKSSLADLSKAVKDNGRTLDENTAKGRAVKSAFLDAASAAMTHAEAVADQTNSVTKGDAALDKDVTQLKATLKQAGFTTAQIRALTAAYAQIPAKATTAVSAPGALTTASQLSSVHNQILATPSAHSVKVTALTTDARNDLTQLGFKVTNLPDHKIQVTLPTHGPMTAADLIQARINALQGKSVTIRVNTDHTITTSQGYNYANGGMVPHAANGMVFPGYAPRQDSIMAMVSPGEGVLVPEAVRKLGGAKAIGALNKWGRYGTTVMPHFADGGTAGGFTYTPTDTAPALGGTDDAMARYTAAIAALTAAIAKQATTSTALTKARTNQTAVRVKEANAVSAAEKNLQQVRSHPHTHAQLIAAEDKLTKARQTATAADKKAAETTEAATKAKKAADATAAKADKSLGVAKGSKVPVGFDLAAYEKQLNDSLKATESWRSNLAKVGARGGSAVEAILQGMGQDGAALTAALAKASSKDFATIVKNLQSVSDQAKATLSDFDSQVSASAKTNAQFSSDLTSLASRGYGALAQQLASQGDQSAMDLAHEAAGASASQLAKLNKDVTAQANTLTGTDLQNALLVLSSLRSKAGEGISDVIGAGISAGDLLTLTPKILSQIQALPDAYKKTFLAQWAGQTGNVTAMFSGGILADGSNMVLAGERGTGGEAWIPLGPGNRARSTALLDYTAGRMGYHLVPAGSIASTRASGASGPQEVHHHKSITLNGAKQDSATQAADLMRHMTVLG